MRAVLTLAICLLFALLLSAPPAFAQYAPPPYQTSNSTIAFQATAKTVALATTTTSANIALPISQTGQVQIYNSGTTAVFLIFCTSSSCTASAGSTGTQTSDYPVGPGAVVIVTVPAGTTYAAAINGSGTGTTYLTPGIGI